MFRHVRDIIPDLLAVELRRLATLDRNWVELEELEGMEYKLRVKYPTWVRALWQSGGDGFGMWGYSVWLADGPKVFRPTVEQCRALEQVEVRLELHDYSQPYPAILVDLPAGYEPFESVLCFRCDAGLAAFNLNTKDHLGDIVTTVKTDGRPMEVSLQKFDEDCADTFDVAGRALRVACNSCLALSGYGTVSDYLYPKDAENDRKLARERSDRGARARKRLETSPLLVKFAQDVVLHRTESRRAKPGEPTGAEMPSHWRRGHWAMQPCGPNHSLRKRILRPPVFVRADRAVEMSQTTTTYHT